MSPTRILNAPSRSLALMLILATSVMNTAALAQELILRTSDGFVSKTVNAGTSVSLVATLSAHTCFVYQTGTFTCQRTCSFLSGNILIVETSPQPTTLSTGPIGFQNGYSDGSCSTTPFPTQTFSVSRTFTSANYTFLANNDGHAPVSNNVTLVVNKVGSVTGVTVLGTPTAGSVQVRANVVSSGGPQPTGSVQFSAVLNGLVYSASAPVDGQGFATATLSLPASTVSTTVTAAYGGDPNLNASSGQTTISSIAKATSSTSSVAATPNPAEFNTPVSLSASVTGFAPTGNVNFKEGNTIIASAIGTNSSGANGSTTFQTTATLSPGTHDLVASYLGDSNNLPSSSPTPFQIIVSHWGGATLIETDNAGSASSPQIAMDANGNAIAVWYQFDGALYNIWANRYAAGGGWGAATLLETNNTGSAFLPQIAMDANGNAIAVWFQYDGVLYNIWANRYTAGSGWGAATLIETNNAGTSIDPQIAMDATGNAIAVWTQVVSTATPCSDTPYGSGGSHTCYSYSYSIWANRYTVGSGWGAATLIPIPTAGDSQAPQVAVDANGNAIAVWFQSDGAKNNVWASRFTPGSGWGAAAPIETDDVSTASPQIAMNANGDAIVAWYQQDATRNHIWVNRFTPGSGWGVPTQIETDNTGGGAYFPRIAMDATGNAIAVWNKNDGVRDNIWANRYTAGSGWGAAALIETDNAGDAGGQQIAMNANGNAVAVWHAFDGTRYNMWANQYTAGSGWGAAELIEIDNAGNAVNPDIAMDATGNATAVWYQSDGVRDNIWANRFTP